MTDFIPFDATPEEAKQRLTVLRPGVPRSMRKQFTTWVVAQIATERGNVYVKHFHELENVLDLDFGLNPAFTGLMGDQEARKFLEDMSEQNLLRIADYLLSKHGRYKAPAERLEKVLSAGRSKWTTVERDGAYRLGARVPEGVLQAATTLAALDNVPGALLAEAWNKVHELEPDDSGAYAAAVKAVEAASFTALGITANDPTLGNSIRAIEAESATWRLPFKREHSAYPSRDVLLGMLKSLWRGHRDRHGSDAYEGVTHEEALGAVYLAVTLVGWFSAGLVQERDTEEFG